MYVAWYSVAKPRLIPKTPTNPPIATRPSRRLTNRAIRKITPAVVAASTRATHARSPQPARSGQHLLPHTHRSHGGEHGQRGHAVEHVVVVLGLRDREHQRRKDRPRPQEPGRGSLQFGVRGF